MYATVTPVGQCPALAALILAHHGDFRGDFASRDFRRVERLFQILKDTAQPKEKRVEALMYLVHLVGDIHQPLHAAEHNEDNGGNYVFVTLFDQPTSLHMLWDEGIIGKYVYDWGEYVRRLDKRWFPGKDIAALQRGEPADWANESHKAAVDVAYALPPGHHLKEDYYNKSLAVVDRQLAVAGLRLARVLNEALRN
jgi:hypothetical protein